MIARLWWKEARQVWPIWAFLAGLGLFWMSLLRWYVNTGSGPRLALVGQAILITFVYLFLIGAAAFAGERENRTLGLLDALPVERWRVWIAKATFAAASTTALGLALLLFAMAMEGSPPGTGREVVGFLCLCGFGWSLFWSALSGNALLAATLGMGSLALVSIQLNWGAPLMFLLDLKPDALTAWHWLFAIGPIPASAAILQLGGPPRGSWFGSGGGPRPSLDELAEAHINRRRSVTVWPDSAAASRLAWQAWRETWPVWWPLAVLGIGIPLVLSLRVSPPDPGMLIPSAWFVCLILGVNVFNAENRGRTQRFLAHHGARPGVVWLVKLAVGLAAVVAIWLAMYALAILLSALHWPIRQTPIMYPLDFVSIAKAVVWGIMVFAGFAGGVFAAGAWCGMVFRRGITAALVSLVFWLVVCGPPLLLVSGMLMKPEHLFWIPVAILAVTWAWSGDWLLDRPGFGRWARLGLYSIAAAVGLSSAYVANRIWNIPTLDPAERERIFQFDRIAAPIPPEENAADLYRAIGRKLGYPPIETKGWDFRVVVDDADWDAGDPAVVQWLSRNEANLKALRDAAAMPACRFADLRKMNVFALNQSVESNLGQLAPTLAVSSRVRLARGDLKGAWDDINALLGMGRQFTRLNPSQTLWWGDYAESWALSLAMRWAADPRQTAESLEEARDAIRSLPPLPSLADQLRADALVFNNTIRMAREDFVLEAMARQGKHVSPFVKLSLDAMTTPWELARLRRVYDLLAAARIQAAEAAPTWRVFSPPFEQLSNPLVIDKAPSATVIPAAELQELAATTPLASIRGRELGLLVALPANDNIAPRQALDAVLGLRLWQVRHDGRLPRSLDELEAADPEVRESLIDPYSNPPARFGYVASEGQSLLPLGQFNPTPDVPSVKTVLLKPSRGFMLLYSVGPDGKDDRASFNLDDLFKGDIVFPLKDNVPPPN